MYADRIPPGEPPCVTCKELPKEENEDALRIFFMVRNQIIVGPQGPIEINHMAIHAAMELYQIQKRQECFEKVVALWWAMKERT